MLIPGTWCLLPQKASSASPVDCRLSTVDPSPVDTHVGHTVTLEQAARQLLRPEPTAPEKPTARFKWEGISSPPAIGEDGTLYMGVAGGKTPFEGRLEARAQDGTVLWSVETRGKCKDTPLLHEGKLLVPLSDPFSVSSFDPKTGELLGTRKDAGGPLVAGKSGVFARTWRQEIVKVNGGWTFELKTTESLAELKVAPEGQLYASTRQGTLYALDPRSGNVLWSKDAPDGEFTLDKDRVFVASKDGKSVLQLGHDGQLQSTLEGFQRANPCGVAPDGTLLVADRTDMFRNDLRAFSPDGTKRWTALVKDAAIGEVRYDSQGRILVPSGNYFNHSGALECFTPGGQLLWRAGMSEPPRTALGPDNAIYALDPFYQLHALNDPAPKVVEANAPPRVFQLGDAVVVGGVRVKKRPA